MSRFASRGLYLVLFTGGLTLLGAGVANAADTTGDDGVLSGTQIVAPITAPIEITGNAIGLLGNALSGAAAAAPAAAAPAVSAPAAAAPAAAAAPVAEPAVAAPPVADHTVAAPSTSGLESLLGGTQAILDVAVPVTIDGNAVGLLGRAEALSAATPAATPTAATPTAADATAVPAAPTTSGSDGIASGTQVLPTITIPVTISGNSVGLLGNSSAAVAGAPSDGVATPAADANDATPAGPTAGGATTNGDSGLAGGTQLLPTITIPVTIGGNAIGVLGDAAASGSTSTGSTTAPTATPAGSSTAPVTAGGGGILAGTQIVPNIALPITIGGNAIGLIGSATTTPGATGPLTGVPAVVVPVDPAVPGDPAVPADPATPTTVDNTPAATVVAASGTATSRTAVASIKALASTGAELTSALAFAAALLLAGLGLALGARRSLR